MPDLPRCTVLRRLLREEVDPNATVRNKLVSALLLGGNVTVRKGSDVGGPATVRPPPGWQILRARQDDPTPQRQQLRKGRSRAHRCSVSGRQVN